MFQMSVSVDMAPAVQIMVYSVLPSENVVAASVLFDTDLFFQNQVLYDMAIFQVSLKGVFPAMVIPVEGNVLMVSVQAGSL